MLECIIHCVLSYSVSFLYLCLAYICECISDLHIYIAATSLYSQDQGITTSFSTLGSRFNLNANLAVHQQQTWGLRYAKRDNHTSPQNASLRSFAFSMYASLWALCVNSTRKPMSSAFPQQSEVRVQYETRVSVIIDNHELGQLRPPFTHLMRDYSPLMERFKGLITSQTFL